MQQNWLSTIYIRKGGISLRLLFLVVLCSSIFTLLASTYQLYFYYRDDVSSLHENMAFVQSSYLQPISGSLYTLDYDQLDLLLKSAIQLKDVAYIEIREHRGGKELIRSVGNPNMSRDFTQEFSLEYFTSSSSESYSVGNLTVVGSFENIYSRTWEKAFVVIVTNAGKMFLTSFCILLIFQSVVTRHLLNLAEHVRKTDINKKSTPLRLDRKPARKDNQDELDEVVNSINETSKRGERLISEMQMTEKRIRDFAESASDWFWEMDADLRYTYLSDRYKEITGVEIAARIGTRRWDFSDPNVQPEKRAAHKADLEDRLPFKDFEYYQGEAGVYLRASGVPFFDDAGIFKGYRGSTSDITGHKHIENALLDSEARLSLHIQNTPLGCISWDTNFHCTAWNKSAEKIFGYTADEAIGHHAAEIVVPGKLKQEINHIYSLLLQQIGGEQSTNENITKGGKIIVCDWYNTPIVAVDGVVMGVSSLVLDITESVEAGEALRRSQKMDAIGQLTGGIAHDFNNILGIIIGNLRLFKDQVEDDESSLKRIDTIDRAAQRAAELVKQLLGFSRHQATDVVVVDPNRMILDMDDLIKRSITPEVKVDQQLAKDLWLAGLNVGDFQDTLLNLVINARDAMPDGGRLTIKTSNCTLDEVFCAQHSNLEAGDYVQLDVSDNGVGITPEQQDKIFDPFYTTKPVGKGTGLGLSMVFGFITRSNGHIDIDSEPGSGTTFHLYLPRAAERRLADNIVDHHSEELPRGGETILAVDDETDLLELATEILETLGYRVVTASNGKEALERLAEHPTISLLFSDMIMPGGMSGYELADRITAKRSDIKVLLASGHLEKARTQAHGEFNMLMKPYTNTALAQRVRSLLGRVES